MWEKELEPNTARALDYRRKPGACARKALFLVRARPRRPPPNPFRAPDKGSLTE